MNKEKTTTAARTLDGPLAELQAQRLLRVISRMQDALALLPPQHAARKPLDAAIAELLSYGQSLERERLAR